MEGFINNTNPWTGLQFGSPTRSSPMIGSVSDTDWLGTTPDWLKPGFVDNMPQNLQLPNAVMAPESSGWGAFSDMLKGAIGTKEAPGWGQMGLGVAQGMMGAYTGLQQLKLAKETLAENKRQFQMNWGAQKQTTNTALEDRQRARVASNPGAYQSVGDYMKLNGIN